MSNLERPGQIFVHDLFHDLFRHLIAHRNFDMRNREILVETITDDNHHFGHHLHALEAGGCALLNLNVISSS